MDVLSGPYIDFNFLLHTSWVDRRRQVLKYVISQMNAFEIMYEDYLKINEAKFRLRNYFLTELFAIFSPSKENKKFLSKDFVRLLTMSLPILI